MPRMAQVLSILGATIAERVREHAGVVGSAGEKVKVTQSI